MSPFRKGDTLHVVVERVVDGDGMWVQAHTGQRFEVRLHAIDAPEYGQALAEESQQHLHRLSYGQRFNLEVVTPQDRYGRVVGILRYPGNLKNSLNLQMVLSGWAYRYARYGDLIGLELAENEAKRYRRGVWQTAHLEMRPWDYRRTWRQPRPFRHRRQWYSNRVSSRSRRSSMRASEWGFLGGCLVTVIFVALFVIAMLVQCIAG